MLASMGEHRPDVNLLELTIGDLRALFAESLPSSSQLEILRADPRAGVQDLVIRCEERRRKDRAESRRLTTRLKYERVHWELGLERIAGCDEAGVSPLAGPVVAAAVILRKEDRIRGVDDSKVLDKATRERLAEEIRERAVAWAVAEASPEEIDTHNIFRATLLAMKRAIEALDPAPQHALIDARRIHDLAIPHTPIVKGDALSLSIGAASILAKTSRDRLMVQMDEKYPGYGFDAHKGYPVPAHFESLRRLGPCPIHRRSFAAVRELLSDPPSQQDLFGTGSR